MLVVSVDGAFLQGCVSLCMLPVQDSARLSQEVLEEPEPHRRHPLGCMVSRCLSRTQNSAEHSERYFHAKYEETKRAQKAAAEVPSRSQHVSAGSRANVSDSCSCARNCLQERFREWLCSLDKGLRGLAMVNSCESCIACMQERGPCSDTFLCVRLR